MSGVRRTWTRRLWGREGCQPGSCRRGDGPLGGWDGEEHPSPSSASHPTRGPLAEPTPNVEGGRPRAPEPGKEPTVGGGADKTKANISTPAPEPSTLSGRDLGHPASPRTPLGLSPLIPSPTPGSKAVTSAGRSPLHRPPLGGPSAGSPAPEAAPAAALLPLPLPERPLPTAQEPRLPPAGGRQSPHSLASQGTERGSPRTPSPPASLPAPRVTPGARWARGEQGQGRPLLRGDAARASLHDGSLRVCLF